MDPDLLLRVLAALADYLLKTTLAFCLCFALSQLVRSPAKRLAVWLSFLFGATGYWLWLAKNAFEAVRSGAHALPGVFQPAASAVKVWQLQSSWVLPLGITIRVAGSVYLFVIAYLFCSHLRKWWRLRWVMKFTTDAPMVLNHRFHILADGLGVGHSRLLILSGVSSPATFGCIRPTVLLPDVCLQQDPPSLDDILLHELHHVRRWDFVWSRLAMMCRALVFFHPAFWYALRRANLERELACDLAVVTYAPERRATYAECLIRFARLHADQQEKPWGVDFAGSQHLKLRVHSILAESKTLSVWAVCMRAACGAAMLAGFVGVVPSLAVLLSYTQQQMAQPLNPGTVELTPVTETGRGNNRHPKLLPIARPAGSLRATANSIEPSKSGPPGLDDADSEVISAAVIPDNAGPQLAHRPSPGTGAAKNTKQQTITLLDPGASGQDGKAVDRKQALEQSATTAYGIYRSVGAVGRH